MVNAGLPVKFGFGVDTLVLVALGGAVEFGCAGGGAGAGLEFAQTRQLESYHLQNKRVLTSALSQRQPQEPRQQQLWQQVLVL